MGLTILRQKGQDGKMNREKPNLSPITSYRDKLFSPKMVIIYLVVSAVVYGLIYFFFVAGKTNTRLVSSTTQPEAQLQETDSLPVNVLTVTLDSLNNSKQAGTAILTEDGGRTKVSLFVNRTPEGSSLPVHIHQGACPQVGGIKFPLKDVVGGKSETVLNVSIGDLKEQLPLAINIHKSQDDLKTSVACGNIK